MSGELISNLVGWHRDPGDADRLRYFDGYGWTDQTTEQADADWYGPLRPAAHFWAEFTGAADTEAESTPPQPAGGRQRPDQLQGDPPIQPEVILGARRPAAAASPHPGPVSYLPEAYGGQPGAGAYGAANPWYVPLPVANGYPRPRHSRLRTMLWSVGAVLAVGAVILGYVVINSHDNTSHVSLPSGNGVSTTASSAQPGGSGYLFRSASAHFAVRFSSVPTVDSKTKTASGVTLHMTEATDVAALTLVQCVDMTRTIASAQAESYLAGVLIGTAKIDGFVVDQVTATTFQGRPAERADYHTVTGTFTALAVLYGSHRYYMLFGPPGAGFLNLMNSFIALP